MTKKGLRTSSQTHKRSKRPTNLPATPMKSKLCRHCPRYQPSLRPWLFKTTTTPYRLHTSSSKLWSRVSPVRIWTLTRSCQRTLLSSSRLLWITAKPKCRTQESSTERKTCIQIFKVANMVRETNRSQNKIKISSSPPSTKNRRVVTQRARIRY